MKYFLEVFQALECIETQLENEISVQHVAQQSKLSSWHFQRIFSEYVGESIGSYLRRRRLASSIDLLKNSNLRTIDGPLKLSSTRSLAIRFALVDEFPPS
jgi:transcriptional regulator GlxA family with amidase domain